VDRGERWERAKRETHGLKDWRAGVGLAVIAGVGSILALLVFGSPGAAGAELLVIAGAVVFAYLVRPLLGVGWNYLWAPWRVAQEQINDIYERLPKQISKEPVETPPDVELTLRNYLRLGREKLEKTEWGVTTAQEMDIESWTGEVTQFLSKNVSRTATKQFIDASTDVSGVAPRLEARIAALVAVIGDLEGNDA
jgi:hypothetical protein